MITGELVYMSMASILTEFITETQEEDRQSSKMERLFNFVLQIGFITIAAM